MRVSYDRKIGRRRKQRTRKMIGRFSNSVSKSSNSANQNLPLCSQKQGITGRCREFSHRSRIH